jgi:acyl carrier protein
LDRKEVTDRVISVLKKFEKVDAAKVTPAAHFYNDLGLDSLDAVEVRDACSRSLPTARRSRRGCAAIRAVASRGTTCRVRLVEHTITRPASAAALPPPRHCHCVSTPLPVHGRTPQVCMALEEEFCITIPDAEAEKIVSTEEAINFIATHPQAK